MMRRLINYVQRNYIHFLYIEIGHGDTVTYHTNLYNLNLPMKPSSLSILISAVQ